MLRALVAVAVAGLVLGQVLPQSTYDEDGLETGRLLTRGVEELAAATSTGWPCSPRSASSA